MNDKAEYTYRVLCIDGNGVLRAVYIGMGYKDISGIIAETRANCLTSASIALYRVMKHRQCVNDDAGNCIFQKLIAVYPAGKGGDDYGQN